MSTSPLNFGTAGFLRGQIVLQDRTIGRDFLKYLQALESHIITLFPLKVAQLPPATSKPAPLQGSVAYATDGRKQGEGPGAGTGVPIYFSNGFWRRYSDDTQVQS